MIMDLQGVQYQICDPEIATLKIVDDSEFFFCVRNMSSQAIETFQKTHKCDVYCTSLNLKSFDDRDWTIVEQLPV